MPRSACGRCSIPAACRDPSTALRSLPARALTRALVPHAAHPYAPPHADPKMWQDVRNQAKLGCAASAAHDSPTSASASGSSSASTGPSPRASPQLNGGTSGYLEMHETARCGERESGACCLWLLIAVRCIAPPACASEGTRSNAPPPTCSARPQACPSRAWGSAATATAAACHWGRTLSSRSCEQRRGGVSSAWEGRSFG